MTVRVMHVDKEGKALTAKIHEFTAVCVIEKKSVALITSNV